MKAGTRAVGVAESYRGRNVETPGGSGPPARRGERSTLAAVVARADRTVDGFAFGSCTVGGRDGTDAIRGLVDDLDREDVQYVMVAGIAPAWFNVLDLPAIQAAVDRPVLSVSFESSPGLEPALRREFDGESLELRLETYRRQPERTRLALDGGDVFVRAVGIDHADARDVVRAFTPEGGRPEPLRVARLSARAADRWRADS